MRPQTDFRTASKENYLRFCAEYPQHKITFKEFTHILYTWNDFLMTNILETGDKVKLPYGFGSLAINKKPTTRFYEGKDGIKHCILPVDWPKSREAGKRIFIFNHHTEGFRFKWYWFKKEARISHTDIWRFKPARKYSKLLHSYLTLKKDKNYVNVYHEWHLMTSRKRHTTSK